MRPSFSTPPAFALSVPAALGSFAIAIAALVTACGSTGNGFGGSSSFEAGVDATLDGTLGDAPRSLMSDTGTGCVHSTCAALGANCGAVSDPKCGGVIQCGTCIAPALCGGGGKPNVCGTGGDGGGGDGCSKQTCASQNLSCGTAGDGCGGTLACGTCSAPQTCGGDPSRPGACGCTGVCASVPTCEAGTTTLTGKVYDPAGTYGLYHALVYIPNDPTDPGLQPFAAGITCDVCGATAAGSPLVTAYTGPDGTFTLSGVPVGPAVPLVIQLGRWRRQFQLNVVNACAPNAIADKTLEMPSTHAQGDMPRIAIMTGAFDPVECVLRKIGIADSEFTDPTGPGYINFYTANDPNSSSPGFTGAGARISAATPSQDALFVATGGPGGGPVINKYDMTIIECEAYPEPQSTAQQAALVTYLASGGRAFASDFQYAWFYQNPGLVGSAAWAVAQNGGGAPQTGVIDQPPANPIGADFEKWLQIVGVASAGGTVSLTPVFHNTNGVVAPTQQWLHWGGTVPIHFTFNTPLGAPPAKQCGRATYSDWHAQSGVLSGSTTFPGVCQKNALTPQEAILEFMLFDLSACVQPYTPVCTPKTCQQENIGCGPAGDGCGGPLDCGPCPNGQVCGGGGPSQCGTATTCNPESCSSQKIQCGPAGDGCGHVLQCGMCPTGQICGLNAPGQCGTPTK